MDSKKITALMYAVESGSLTAAAARMGYTQAGLTNMMNSLESELGLSLLVRGKGGVHLSPAGQKLLPQLRGFALAAEELESRAKEIREKEASFIRVGAFSSVARHWLPSIVSEFKALSPETDVIISAGGIPDGHEAVRSGELDCAFVSDHPGLRQGLDWVPLRKDPLLAILPAAYETKDGRFPVEGFEKVEFLMPTLGFDLDIQPVFDSVESKVQPHIRYTNLDDAAIVSMVEHDLGLSILSELVMKSMTDDVQALPLEPPAFRHIGIISSSRRQSDRNIRRFIHCAQTTLSNMYEGDAEK